MKKTGREINREKLNNANKELFDDLQSTEDKLSKFWERASQGSFTNHGRSHIEMVETYVGELLGDDRLENHIYPEEFFILLMGVFCHDLGMVRFEPEGGDSIKIERELHNVESYLFVNSEQATKSIIVPDGSYYKPISLLCLGHRDYKDKDGKTVHTLVDNCRINDETVKVNEIITIGNVDVHLSYLAAILRLADELDVTNNRAPEDVKMYFKDFIPETSYDHWVKHQLIKKVTFKNEGAETQIVLVPNVEKIQALSDGSEDNIPLDHLLRIIFSVRKKLENEIEQINPITFSPRLVNDHIAVKFAIKVNFDNEVVTEDAYERYQTSVNRQFTEEKKAFPQDATDYDESMGITQEKKKTHKEVFNDELQRLKKDRNILETGSFKFSFETGRSEYTKYFINTQLLLTNRSTLDSITEIFKEYYHGKNIDCVIGIGKAGIVLSPNLSLKMKCNSSYLICDWEDSSSVKWEKDTSVIETAKNVIVLLDVISTGTVTKQAIEIIKQKNKTNLDSIYVGTVFCTNNAIKAEIEKVEKVKDMFVINDDFQFRTYTQEEYDSDEKFRKEFELLPLRKK